MLVDDVVVVVAVVVDVVDVVVVVVELQQLVQQQQLEQQPLLLGLGPFVEHVDVEQLKPWLVLLQLGQMDGQRDQMDSMDFHDEDQVNRMQLPMLPVMKMDLEEIQMEHRLAFVQQDLVVNLIVNLVVIVVHQDWVVQHWHRWWVSLIYLVEVYFVLF